MNVKLMVGILVIAAMPGWAQAQSAVTNEDAQQLVDTISGAQDKSQAYCDIIKLGDQIDQADQRGETTDKLNQKMDTLTEKLGPEWSALMSAYRDVDLNTKGGLETAATMQTTIETLNKLCGPAPPRSGRD
jgi:hypothetical protein